jgi:hypothetical protein
MTSPTKTLNYMALELMAAKLGTPITDHALSPDDPQRVFRTGYAKERSRTATWYQETDVLIIRIPTRHPAWPREYTTQTYVIDPDLQLRTRINGMVNNLRKELLDGSDDDNESVQSLPEAAP